MFARSFGRFFRRRLLRALPVLALALTRCSSFARAGSVEVVGAIGGRITQEETDGAITYVARGLNLEIEQRDADGGIHLLARLHMPDFIQRLVRNGSALYVDAGGANIIDVSAPSQPRFILTTGGNDHRSSEIFLADSILVYATGEKHSIDTLQFFDVAEPLRPVRVELESGGSVHGKFYAVGNGAFFTLGWGDGDGDLVTSVVRRGPTQGKDQAMKLPPIPKTEKLDDPVSEDDGDAVTGLRFIAATNELFICASRNRLVLNVANPNVPTVVRVEPDAPATEDPPPPAPKPAVHLPRPDPERDLGRQPFRDALQNASVAAVDGMVAAVGDGGQLVLLDLSDPARPQITGKLGGFDAISAIALRGSFAYLLAAKGGLIAVDMSNPAAPRVTTAIADPRVQITIANDHLYLWGEAPDAEKLGIRIFDLADPAAPHEIGIYDRPGRFAASGPTGILADGRLHLLDLSVPGKPAELSVLPPESKPTDTGWKENPGGVNADDAIISGALVMTPGALVNAPDPRNPVRISQILNGEYAGDTSHLALTPQWACVSGYHSMAGGGVDDLAFQNISDPKEPGPVIHYPGPCSHHSSTEPIIPTAAGGDLFVVTDGGGGLLLLRPNRNLSQPEVAITTAR